MGQMKRLSNDGSGKQEKRSETKIERRRKVMVALWYRASQYLGPIWESQFGGVNDDTIYAWQEELRMLTEQEIAVGVAALGEWIEKYPPTLGQFRALCKNRPFVGTVPLIEHTYDRDKARKAGTHELKRMNEILKQAEDAAQRSEQSKRDSIAFLAAQDPSKWNE